MTFAGIWLIGYWIWLGITWDSIEKGSFWEGVVFTIMAIFLWPVMFGILLRSWVENSRK